VPRGAQWHRGWLAAFRRQEAAEDMRSRLVLARRFQAKLVPARGQSGHAVAPRRGLAQRVDALAVHQHVQGQRWTNQVEYGLAAIECGLEVDARPPVGAALPTRPGSAAPAPGQVVAGGPAP